jgi:hypothetical protein
MVTFDYLLREIYEIQGTADPNQGESTLTERMREIWERCCEIMRRSGYEPD